MGRRFLGTTTEGRQTGKKIKEDEGQGLNHWPRNEVKRKSLIGKMTDLVKHR